MSTGTQTCEITIPGYTLAERIGSGGYAEVWRAEAPGGIEKAVKVVYGYHDDEFASQELKSLERIKGVRHPFLLSLERFEIVNGRLVILTELADMSLDQRRRQCGLDGLPGIPREELLRYMADAAEALDYLSQRHNLLHLDIKPENLLILGDHIKVADFGLVKELATRTQNSLVSGMTPTYAAPEMFDDDPSAQSDQYSLAIVYQEMLVGSLPFPGRTPAQLAKQHTQAEPQLMSLPAADRPFVARALAKQPTERFPSCRAFVDALLRRPEAAIAIPHEVPRPTPVTTPPPAPKPDDTKPPSFCTTIRRPQDPDAKRPNVTVTRPVHREAPAAVVSQPEPHTPCVFVPEEIVDIAAPVRDDKFRCEQPTLYVATGGVGIQALCRLRAMLAAKKDDAHDTDQAFETVAFDTNRDDLRDACSARWNRPLSSDDTIHLPLRLPKDYDNARDILGWVSRRWLYNIPRSLETRGYRPLGRVALVDHSRRVCALLDQKLKRLKTLAGSADAVGQPRDTAIKIVLLTSTGGGTGAGMAIDIANAVRALAVDHNVTMEIHGYFVCTCFANNASSPLAAANTYSLLAELNHAMAVGNQGPDQTAAHAQWFESCQPPFDFIYWLPARSQSSDTGISDTLDSLAKYLVFDKTPETRAVLRTCRQSPTPREQSRGPAFAIRKFGVASFADQERAIIAELSRELAEAIKRHWLATDDSADWERLVRGEQQAAAAASKPETVPGGETNEPPVLAPAKDTTPLALRGRFKEYLSLEFASETVFQIERRLDSRDDRGRPLLLPREAKFIVDAARDAVSSLAQLGAAQCPERCCFSESPVLRPLIAEGSRRVLGRAVDNFDFRQPARSLSVEIIDENLAAESRALLEEALALPLLAAAITTLIDLDRLATSALATATVDFLQCGHDRRTLFFVPNQTGKYAPAADKLSTLRSSAAAVPADIKELFIVSEEAGISPRSLAAGFERVFPGIADAARRLFTRIDIEWQNV